METVNEVPNEVGMEHKSDMFNLHIIVIQWFIFDLLQFLAEFHTHNGSVVKIRALRIFALCGARHIFDLVKRDILTIRFLEYSLDKTRLTA